MFPLINSIIVEATKNRSEPLPISKTSAYKRGFKKHKNDARVTKALKDVMSYLIYHKDIPPEYNDHQLSNGTLKGLHTLHLKGQQVVMLYRITNTSLDLLGLGSHHEIGTM